jgi:hypothetical protein
MHKATIRMMHASSYSSSQDCQPKVVIMFYVSGITHILSIYIASRQLHSTYAFVVSVLAENFSLQPNNSPNMARNESRKVKF